MTNSVPEIRTMHGLYLQPNTFDVPDGALEEAENIVVKNDKTLTSRRGFYEYFAPLTGTLNNLFIYQSTLLAVYNNKIRYYTDTGSAPNKTGSEGTITGETFTVSGTSRSLQANSNFYFNTDEGMLKLTAYNSALSEAGAPPGLDLTASFANDSTTGWFTPGNTVGYRILFGYTDDNDNEILGAPSQIAEINNTSVTGKSYTSSGSGPWTITVSSALHGLQTGDYLVFSTGTSANANGTYQITVVSANSFTYSENTGDPTNGTVDYAYAMPVRLEFSIPSDISTALPWFYRVYRSSQQLISVGIFSDFQLVTENMLTSSEISAHVAFYDDTVDDLLLGAQLYTNENSGEGESQSNFRPPMCKDVAYFQNYALYANCTSRHLLNLNVVDPTQLVAGDYIETKVDATTRRYVGHTGVANSTVVGACSSSSGLLITYNSHGLANNYTIYISNIIGGTLTSGTYYVVSATTNTFKISLSSGGSAIAYNGETSLSFEGVTDGTYPIFQISESTSAAVRLTDTATYIIRAINRDISSLIYGEYISAINGIPGQMRFQAKGFTGTIYVRANTTTAGSAFSPALPDSFNSGNQVFSKNDHLPNVIFISKLGEPEAVPIVNFLPAGSKNFEILRIRALRDSVIIVKEDGVYRMTGDNISNFSIVILDNTVFCVAENSLSVLNNQVVFLSNQGVCLVSESSVQIISREKIEDEIQPILGKDNLSAQTAGVGYETERLYLITTILPNENTATVNWCFNILTNEWTSWDQLFVQAIIGPEDRMYYITLDNKIQRERKEQTAIDYSDQNYDVSIDAIDGTAATITVSGGLPKEGDMIVKDDVITWIDSEPVLVSGNTYTVVFNASNNLAQGDNEIIYTSFYHRIKFSPFHGGELSKMKLFSQFMMHFRNNYMTKAIMSFTGYALGGSGSVDWSTPLTNSQGWGSEPWGFFGWGEGNGIDLPIGTGPAGVMRILVPAFQARTTYIQAEFEHRKAGEPLGIQAISYVVRPYNERVTR